MKLLLCFLILFVTGIKCPQYVHAQQPVLTGDVFSPKKKGPEKRALMPGDKYLVLDRSSRVGKFRRYRVFVGEEVNFKLSNENKRYKTTLLSLTDSSLFIANDTTDVPARREIKLSDIRIFTVARRVPFVSEASYYLPIGGLLYIGADFFNKGIDGNRYTTDASAFIVGGTLIAAGFVCYKLSSGKFKINDRNQLKVLTSY